MNRKRFWVWRGFVRTTPVDFWREREERASDLMATVLGQGRIVRERGVLEVVWRLKVLTINLEAARTLGLVGFNLLSQLTELTTNLYIFSKQWHTCL